MSWKEPVSNTSRLCRLLVPVAVLLPQHRWLAALWRDEELNLRDAGRATAEPLVRRQTVLAAEIDRHLVRPETDRVCDYRPARGGHEPLVAVNRSPTAPMP